MGTGRYSASRTGMGSSLSECKIERYLAVWYEIAMDSGEGLISPGLWLLLQRPILPKYIARRRIHLKEELC